jgi:DNA-binding NtrC family response regulator
MPKTRAANVLLLGLDNEAARRIESILIEAGHYVRKETLSGRVSERPNADVIFLWGDHRNYPQALAEIRAHPDHPPVVLATRLPDTCSWINSMEAGVADYCVAPFNATHVLWALETALNQRTAKTGRVKVAESVA